MGTMRRLAAIGSVTGLDVLGQTEKWWRALMMRQADIEQEPPGTEEKLDVPEWPSDDRFPKTPWRGGPPKE